MRLPNRSLQICVIERDAWSKHATDFDRPGLYVLIDDAFEISRAYVGETEAITTRLTQHFRDPAKQEYRAAVVVHDDGTMLDKLGAKYLEHRVVSMLSQHGLLTNAVKPATPKIASHLAEALEELIVDLQFVCFSVNLNLFERERVSRTQMRAGVTKTNSIKQRPGRTAKASAALGQSWSALEEWLRQRPGYEDSAATVRDFITQGGPAGKAPKVLHLAAHNILKTAVRAGFKFAG